MRDPAAVLADLDSGLVSEKVAKDVYGVCRHAARGERDSDIDVEATTVLRKVIRARRLSEGKRLSTRGPVVHRGEKHSGLLAQNIGAALDRLETNAGPRYVCRHCKHPICCGNEDPKSGALARLVKMENLSHWNGYGLVDEIVVREFCCPKCAHLIAVEVRRKDDPVLYDTCLG